MSKQKVRNPICIAIPYSSELYSEEMLCSRSVIYHKRIKRHKLHSRFNYWRTEADCYLGIRICLKKK